INEVGNKKHWAGLRVVGQPVALKRGTRGGGRDALGARVEIIRRNGPTLWRRARADGSYASANDPRILVGLGDSAEAPPVRVHWPDGEVTERKAIATDQYTTIVEGAR